MFVFMVFKINFIVWPIITGLVLYIKDLQTSQLKLVCQFEQSLFPPHITYMYIPTQIQEILSSQCACIVKLKNPTHKIFKAQYSVLVIQVCY